MSTFILSAGLTTLPPSDPLNLLPFSLTPTPATARIQHFFRPRSAPAGHAAGEGTPVATFRGRQVVGQHIALPPGYRGVILRASGGPHGSVATASGDAGASATYPLTPAASTASIASASTSASASTTPSAPSASTRTTRARTRGAGQVALAKPSRAAPRKAPKTKRIVLESDGEEDEDVVKPAKRVKAEAAVTVPEIRITVSAPEGEGEAGPEVAEVDLEQAEREEERDKAEAVGTPTGPAAAAEKPDPEVVQAHEPAAQVPTYDEAGLPVRRLVPSAAFGAFTLWSADIAVPGFDASEGEGADEENDSGGAATDQPRNKAAKTEREPEPDMETETEPTEPKTEPTTETDISALHRGWWRRGGGGEGGDEFVRALGEWIGLGQIIHEACYDVDDEDE